jgi:hypothetical protein
MKWPPIRDAVSCNCTTDKMQEKNIMHLFRQTGSYIEESSVADITALILSHITALKLPHITALILPNTSATSQICRGEEGDAP